MTVATQQALDAAKNAFKGGQYEVAAELATKLLWHFPGQVDAKLTLGLSLARLNQPEKAIQILDEVLPHFPDSLDVLVASGIMLHQMGRFVEARDLLNRALKVDSTSLLPYVGILRGHRATEEDRKFIDRAIAALTAHADEDDDARQLTYSIAKAFDDLGDFEKAIDFYDRANRLAASLQKPNGMNRILHSLMLDDMIRVFSNDLLSRAHPFADSTRKPIFIIGMIRSGTTLIEQIISRHPAVWPGGEMRFWVESGFSVILPGSPGLNSELAEFLGLEYLRMIGAISVQSARVTDKMPLNYMFVGLLHLLFPQAAIIHCVRDPVDTCLSIYMTPHAQPPDFAYDRSDIVFAYQEYLRTMAHWRKVLPPNRILEVSYEALVSQPEPNIRQILNYCGLNWDPNCLSPEKNERIVNTPSKWQVRQPIYESSVGRSRNYAPWLQEIGSLRE